MKALVRYSSLLILLTMSISSFSQAKEGTALISGKIIFEKDSIYPLKPYSLIFRKDWPITNQQFEQATIDTTDNSFYFKMGLDQATYGYVSVNFFKDLDSTSFETNQMRILSGLGDGFSATKYSARILFTGLRLVIEPGDSLNLVLDYNSLDQHGRILVSSSGIGGANNNLYRSKDLFKPWSESFRMPLQEGLSNENLVMENKLKNLNEAKDTISQTYYDLLKTDILFHNLSKKHALIRASLYGSDMPIEEKRVKARNYYSYLDTLTLRPEYLNSREFRNYLGLYLEYLNRIISGKDTPFGHNEKSYWLAKAVFDEEILKTFLYERLEFEMETPSFFNNKNSQYMEFVERFPDTPEAFRLTKLYTKHLPVLNGQLAPELELLDSTGRKKCLTDLRGKVLIVSSAQALLNIPQSEQKTVRIESLRKKFGDDLVLIALDQRYGKSSPLPNYIDYYLSEDQDSQNFDAYKFLRTHRYYFFIGKNGIINNCVYDIYKSEATVSTLISERYTILTRMKIAAERYIIVIVIMLSILISIILILLLVSKLRQRRQEINRRRLSSELKAIRSQLNPHFLFNSLNSIQNFINKSDSKTANKHLSKFSLLMRKVIELSETDSISLQEEIEFNRTFIELEQLRYGFKCTFDIDESLDLYNTEIPSMIIQPFIENAIVHCMADLGDNGILNITVKETIQDKILIEIKDNGKGFQADSSKGFGLKSSWERIDLINSQSKEKIELQIESDINSQSRKGTIVTLIIPKKY